MRNYLTAEDFPAIKEKKPDFERPCNSCSKKDHVQTLHTCCPTKMRVKCTCGDINVLIPFHIVAAWLKDARSNTSN